MSALAGLQRDFLAAIFAPGAAPDARLDVYRRTVFANLQGALAAAHPVVCRLVGEAFFEGAAESYARAVPSTSGDLNEYGARFAGLLSGYAPANGLEYLADVARLEWALHESHLAADAGALDFEALARVAPGEQGAIRFQLHPAVRLLRSAHPVVAIWHANQEGRDGTPDRLEGPDHVLVRRAVLVAAPELLDEQAWSFLEAIGAGATLEEAGAAFTDAAAIAPALARLAGDGVLCGFRVPGAA